MGFKDIVAGLKEKMSEWSEAQRERREFQKLVEAKTLPIRRAAYLKQKMRDAIIEGKQIASEEKKKYEKQKKVKDESSFSPEGFNIGEIGDIGLNKNNKSNSIWS